MNPNKQNKPKYSSKILSRCSNARDATKLTDIHFSICLGTPGKPPNTAKATALNLVPRQKSLHLNSPSRAPKFTFPFFYSLLKAKAATPCESSVPPAERISPESSRRRVFQCRGENYCFPRSTKSHVKDKKKKIKIK